MSDLPKVTVYTDGASSGKTGAPGGYAAVLVYGEHEREVTGGELETTNQRMELMAAVMGLRALKRPCQVTLVSDSAYLVNCFQQKWHEKWTKNGWINARKKPVLNRDIWEQLLDQVQRHEVLFAHTPGHAGHVYNERCDRLAVEAKIAVTTNR